MKEIVNFLLSLAGLHNRKGKGEDAALRKVRFEPDFPAMSLHRQPAVGKA
jgi:hypothetical protein